MLYCGITIKGNVQKWKRSSKQMEASLDNALRLQGWPVVSFPHLMCRWAGSHKRSGQRLCVVHKCLIPILSKKMLPNPQYVKHGNTCLNVRNPLLKNTQTDIIFSGIYCKCFYWIADVPVFLRKICLSYSRTVTQSHNMVHFPDVFLLPQEGFFFFKIVV